MSTPYAAVRALAMITGLVSVSCVAGRAAAQEPGGPHLEIPEVIERGEGGPVLLLIPCAGCGASSWLRFMEVNDDRFRMIAITLPGYDGSPRPELPLWTNRTVFQDNVVDQISKLLDDRGLTNVTAVGHSFGSTIALRVASARPDVVTGVVNVDGSAVSPALRGEQTPAERLEQARVAVDEGAALSLQDPTAYRTLNGARSQPDSAQQKLHHGMFMASDRVTMLHYWRENFFWDKNPVFRALDAWYLDVEAISPRTSNPDSALAAYDAAIAAIGTPDRYRRVAFFDSSHWIHLVHPRALGTAIEETIDDRPIVDVGPFTFGEVVRAGSGNRELILMPCLGCDASSWDEFMHRNRDRYRMVAVTWPGLGATELPSVLTDPDGTPYFDHLVHALDLLITREGLERPVLVGHSAAAVVAVRFAAERPDRLAGVVNVDAIVANGDTYGFSPEQRLAWADAEMASVLETYDDDDAWAALNAAPAGLPEARGAFYERMWRTPPRANVFAWWRDWLRTDVGSLLPGLEVPFFAIHALPGDPERAAAKRTDLEERYRRAPLPIGGQVVYVPDSGHTIWEYHPEAFDAALESFVLGSIGSR